MCIIQTRRSHNWFFVHVEALRNETCCIGTAGVLCGMAKVGGRDRTVSDESKEEWNDKS